MFSRWSVPFRFSTLTFCLYFSYRPCVLHIHISRLLNIPECKRGEAYKLQIAHSAAEQIGSHGSCGVLLILGDILYCCKLWRQLWVSGEPITPRLLDANSRQTAPRRNSASCEHYRIDSVCWGVATEIHWWVVKDPEQTLTNPLPLWNLTVTCSHILPFDSKLSQLIQFNTVFLHVHFNRFDLSKAESISERW